MEAALRRSSLRPRKRLGLRLLSKIPWRLRSNPSFVTPKDVQKAAKKAAEKKTEHGEGWKWSIRHRIWTTYRVPRRRYPDFTSPDLAAFQLEDLPAFRDAKCVLVDTDFPQKPVREMVLREMKFLFVPFLPRNFLTMLDPRALPPYDLEKASTPAGVEMGTPVGVDSKIKIDLLVFGSVAVDPKTGARIGRGQGHSDLEYAMLRHMKAINEKTLVVTTVDEGQLVEDMPVENLLPYDVPVDIICTPSRIIYTDGSIPKPPGVFWDILLPGMVDRTRSLKYLRRIVEKQTGKPVKLSHSSTYAKRITRHLDGPAIFISGFNPAVTEAEIKQHLEENSLPVDNLECYKTKSKKIVGRLVVEKQYLETYIKLLNGTQLDGFTITARRDEGAASH